MLARVRRREVADRACRPHDSGMQEEASNRNGPLRIAAVLGLLAAALQALTVASWPSGHGWSAGFIALLIAGVAIGATLLLLRPQMSALLANADVFVPTGLAMLATTAIDWAGFALPAVMLGGSEVNLLGLTLTLSVSVIAWVCW